MFALILTILISVYGNSDQAYISQAEVRRVIAQTADTTALRPEDCAPIEQALDKTHMVRKAQCYLQTDGVLVVRIEQREPMYRVANQNRQYWVDQDREIVAIKPGLHIQVPLATGVISDSLARNGLYELMDYLTRDPFYRPALQRVAVTEKGEAIILLTGNRRVLMGAMNKSFPKRLKKLVKLYEKGFSVIGEPEQKEFDLRYKGQVVTR